MVGPILVIAIATAAFGAWELIAGRPLFGRSSWNLSERAHRLYGACSLVLSLVAIALAVTYPAGLAFMTYGIGTLALVGTVQLVTRLKATN
jgi:hypothetical protein